MKILRLIRKILSRILFNRSFLKIYGSVINILLFNPIIRPLTKILAKKGFFEKKIQSVLFDHQRFVELWIDMKMIDIISNKKFLLFISRFLRKDFKAPIFIIASPRSGSSILHQTLSQNKDLSSLKRELDEFWHQFTKGSDQLDETDIASKDKRMIYTFFQLISRDRPFIDKTISNVLKIRFLHKLFLDAKFIFLQRKGQDTINSLINGWKHEQFVSPWFKGQLKDWHFVLLPDWKELIDKPVSLICAQQWLYCNKEILKNKRLVPRSNQITIKYEDFIKNSIKITKSIFNFLDIQLDKETYKYAKELKPLPSNVVTAPKKDKWKTENKKEITSLMYLITPTNKRMGY